SRRKLPREVRSCSVPKAELFGEVSAVAGFHDNAAYGAHRFPFETERLKEIEEECDRLLSPPFEFGEQIRIAMSLDVADRFIPERFEQLPYLSSQLPERLFAAADAYFPQKADIEKIGERT